MVLLEGRQDVKRVHGCLVRVWSGIGVILNGFFLRHFTIASFNHEERTAPDIVARREWTRQWWSDATERYELATSPAVLDELAGGPPERSQKWLDLVRGVPLLPVE